MARKKAESLEFEENEITSPAGGELKEKGIIRQSYRVPYSDEDDVEVFIKRKKYAVLNLSYNGLGVQLPHEGALREGEELSSIEFRMQGKKIKLRGKVVHISKEADNTFLGGIELTGLDEKLSKKITEFILSRRQALFATDNK